MLGVHDLARFVVSGLLLNISPGPDTFYILSCTASRGWRGGARIVGAARGVGDRVRPVAFLPQFIDSNATHKAIAFVFLGCVFNFNASLWNLFVAWTAARVARGVKRSQALRSWTNRVIGVVFVYLGVRLAAAN